MAAQFATAPALSSNDLDSLLMLDAIGDAILKLVPMDTDRPTQHFAVAALVAQLRSIAGDLFDQHSASKN